MDEETGEVDLLFTFPMSRSRDTITNHCPINHLYSIHYFSGSITLSGTLDRDEGVDFYVLNVTVSDTKFVSINL